MPRLLRPNKRARTEADLARAEVELQNTMQKRANYAEKMRLAHQHIQDESYELAFELLQSYRPEANDDDLRGWEWHYLFRQCRGAPLTIAIDSRVESVALSPDGKLVVVGAWDWIQWWDVDSGTAPLAQIEHTSTVSSIAFSADGERIAAGMNPYGERLQNGSSDAIVKVWDVATGDELAVFEGHSDRVGSLEFSPEGDRLATGSGDATVRIWDIQHGRETFKLEGHTGWVSTVRFSPDGRIVASAGGDNSDATIRLWDAEIGEEVQVIKAHEDHGFSKGVTSLSFSPDGNRLAGGNQSGIVVLWDAHTGDELITNDYGEGENDRFGIIKEVAFTADGSQFITATDEGEINVWDAADGLELRSVELHAPRVEGAISANSCV